MIREYALQPDILSSWQDFRYFTEKFSAAQGRLISRFPSRWRRMVHEACAACQPIEKARITEGLNRIGHRLLQNGRAYDSDQPWLTNAIRSHEDESFHAVIACQALAGHDYVLACDEVEDSHPLLKEMRSDRIARTPAALAEAARLLLAISKEIIFVDPHFRPTNRNCRLPLEKFFEKIVTRAGDLPRRIELHVGDRFYGAPSTAFNRFESDCRTELPPCIPAGMELTVVRWAQDCLHNRFILTDRAALMYGTGLDSSTTTGAQTDEVVLLDEAVRRSLWRDYAHRTGDLVTSGDPADIVVVGTHSMGD